MRLLSLEKGIFGPDRHLNPIGWVTNLSVQACELHAVELVSVGHTKPAGRRMTLLGATPFAVWDIQWVWDIQLVWDIHLGYSGSLVPVA